MEETKEGEKMSKDEQLTILQQKVAELTFKLEELQSVV
jgi:hypothetical protein